MQYPHQIDPQYAKTLMNTPELLDAIHRFYHQTMLFLDEYGTDDNGDTIPPRMILAHYFDPALNIPENERDEFARDTMHTLNQLDHYDYTESSAIDIIDALIDLNLLPTTFLDDDDQHTLHEGVYRILDQLFDLCDQTHKVDTN